MIFKLILQNIEIWNTVRTNSEDNMEYSTIVAQACHKLLYDDYLSTIEYSSWKIDGV